MASTISFVLPAYREKAFSEICISSLLSALDNFDYELVLVDDASDDDGETAEYFETVAAGDDRVVVINRPENKGFTVAVNDGLRVATGGVLVVLNNDMIFAPGWLKPLVDILEDKSVGIASPTLHVADGYLKKGVPDKEENIKRFREWYKRSRIKRNKTQSGATVPFVIRRDVFERVGLLDEQFLYGWWADCDYCQSVKRHGYKLVMSQQSVVLHYASRTIGRMAAERPEWWAEICRVTKERYYKKWHPNEAGKVIHPRGEKGIE